VKPKFSQEDHAFVIENYNQARPFSSFLPGIAGEFGKPMWVFYTNRGQCISSFGVRNKGSSMLEFFPANKAYAATPLVTFKTFIRFRRGGQWRLYEPFRVDAGPECRQILRIRAHEIELEETNKRIGLRVTVAMFNAPNDDLPVLIRQMRVENLGRQTFQGDILDGFPRVVPFGLNEYLLKQMSRTMEAFAEVPHVEDRLPFFKLKTEPSDRPEVEWIHGGFFAFTLQGGECCRMVVDKENIFGTDTSLQDPLHFRAGQSVVSRPQRTESQFACVFSFAPLIIRPREALRLATFYGQADGWEEADAFRRRVQIASSYAEAKRDENASVLSHVMDIFALHSSSPRLNAYSKQTYLDNVLRGGQPRVFSDGVSSQMFHCFSRKHGDMERDYNFFELSPTYFSQGDGNFRDVNQNRRSETFLHPGLGAGNVETFFNLLQLDGFNPLVIQFEKFQVGGHLVKPGDLFKNLLKDSDSREEALQQMTAAIAGAKKVQEAIHGEGFWIDHWTYNIDLLESFAAIYPDQLKSLLVERRDFTFYDNDYVVRPRHKKYILRADGAVRQAHAVVRDPEKKDLISRRKEDVHKVRTQGGQGVIYQTSLLGKILTLVAVKTASLDPFGMGLEMEAERPGWCDALNGLPGLLGSSVNEAFELRRFAAWCLGCLPGLLEPGETLPLAAEAAELMRAVKEALALARPDDFFKTWDTLASLRERFREKTRLGVSGVEKNLPREEIEAFFMQVESSLSAGLSRAFTRDGLCSTYFINEVADYEKLPSHPGSTDPDSAPVQHVRALRFKQIPLSPFLEGPVHALRVVRDTKQAKRIYRAVKSSDLYDRKLKMYKLNVPLIKESYEIGRNKIFTPGWLENESIFLHMHYKFLYEILRSGLAEEFFAEMKHGIVAFLDPEVYGRSPFENSSFIVSSRFPDPRIHGTGFVARLSGSTAEWISMVFHMALGRQPFRWKDGQLRFEPAPTLAQWLFTKKVEDGFEKDTFGIKLFGKTWVVYENPARRDTYAGKGLHPVRYSLRYEDGRETVHEGKSLPDGPARDLREGKLSRVTVKLA
jgi:hypothetical protein